MICWVTCGSGVLITGMKVTLACLQMALLGVMRAVPVTSMLFAVVPGWTALFSRVRRFVPGTLPTAVAATWVSAVPGFLREPSRQERMRSRFFAVLLRYCYPDTP